MKIDKSNKQGQKLQQALQEGVLSQGEKIKKDIFNKANNAQKKALLKDKFEGALRKVDANLSTNFRCFNEEHNDSNPSMRFNLEKGGYHCFGCMENGQNFDLFDAIKEAHDCKGFKECYNKAIQLFVAEGQTLVKTSNRQAGRFTKEMYKILHYTFLYKIEEDEFALEFLEKRGISIATANRHGLRLWEYQGWWFIVFVNDNGSMVRRRYSKDDTSKMYASVPSKWWNQRGQSGFFNQRVTEKAALNNDIAFVTEGAFDALTVEELGMYGVALNSAKHIKQFFESNNYQYIVALFDNDSTGMISNARFKEQGYYSVNYEDFSHLNKYKDINEALVADREATKRELAALVRKAKEFYKI
ncbi:toprim domain-containing protein [Lutibacter sp. B2]|nr:toprim domain-containing protein [Lutibacter sp. B2]